MVLNEDKIVEQKVNQGGDKCLENYLKIYATHLEQFRKNNVNFLEIGIFQVEV